MIISLLATGWLCHVCDAHVIYVDPLCELLAQNKKPVNLTLFRAM